MASKDGKNQIHRSHSTFVDKGRAFMQDVKGELQKRGYKVEVESKQHSAILRISW